MCRKFNDEESRREGFRMMDLRVIGSSGEWKRMNGFFFLKKVPMHSVEFSFSYPDQPPSPHKYIYIKSLKYASSHHGTRRCIFDGQLTIFKHVSHSGFKELYLQHSSAPSTPIISTSKFTFLLVLLRVRPYQHTNSPFHSITQ